MMQNKNIIAVGGGSFFQEASQGLLERYILNLTQKGRPRICFIPTASGDDQTYINQFYKFCDKQDVLPSHLSLFRGTTSKLESVVLNQDILFVGGGNTRNLLTLWKNWGLDLIIKEARERGTILCGVSAGSICWFEQGVTDSIPGQLTSLNCLGFLKGSNCPHYDVEVERRPSYHSLLASGEIQPGIAAEDGVAFHFVGDQLHQVIACQPGKNGYRLTLKNGTPNEETLTPIYL